MILLFTSGHEASPEEHLNEQLKSLTELTAAVEGTSS